GDPVLNGATVVISANGGNPTTQTFTLAAGTNPATSKPFWSGDALKGYKYSDPKGANGAVKSAQIKLKNGVFQIKLAVDGKLGAARHSLGARRLVRRRRQDVPRARRRGERLREEGLLQRLDQLSARAARLRRRQSDRAVRDRDQRGLAGRADGRAVPPDERGD